MPILDVQPNRIGEALVSRSECHSCREGELAEFVVPVAFLMLFLVMLSDNSVGMCEKALGLTAPLRFFCWFFTLW